ncbi:MAG: M4 family metallopeptidase, partial [Bacteroidota bacterium]
MSTRTMNAKQLSLGLLCLLLLLIPSLHGQQHISSQLRNKVRPGSESGWLQFQAGEHSATFFDNNATALGISPQDEMKRMRQETDQLGFTHESYQQFHLGVPIEGAVYKVHSLNGEVQKSNGLLAQDLILDVVPNIREDRALKIALNHIGAQVYAWEDPMMESLFQHAHRDTQDSFLPKAAFMIADRDFAPKTLDYVLVYKFDIYTAVPMGRKWIYVDAKDGSIVKELDAHMTIGVPGTAHTRYSGTRTIITDSTANGFSLLDDTRGDGIETLDMLNLNSSHPFGVPDAVPFTDTDNVWDDTTNLDDAALDAHWGAEMTYDYFLEKHGRNSYDDNGSPIVAYIHHPFFGVATWFNSTMFFGDGGTITNNNPLTPIDLVAHEFAHGVTEHTANLIYAQESGALNESFSDIFGNAVEYFAKSNDANWAIGESMGYVARSMSDPYSEGNPDTYQGNAWHTASDDNGGVHINSGVQNFWFYLLVEGGSGTNDHGAPYQVNGIGWDAATQIAYRNLSVYLGPSSVYEDARNGAIQSAIDLFGLCSNEYQQVVNAWAAVGLGRPIANNDFGLIDIKQIPDCESGEDETIEISFQYFGCQAISGPTKIPLAYAVVDPVSTAIELIDLPNGAQPGEIFTHAFQTKVDFSAKRNFEMFAKAFYVLDPNSTNDNSDILHIRNPVSPIGHTITFESTPQQTSTVDSFFIESGSRADVKILDEVGLNASHAISMEGGTAFLQAFPGLWGRDPFVDNLPIKSRVCLCADGRDYTHMSLSFDLRQTYSGYRFGPGTTVQGASRFRLMINEEELMQTQPQTKEADPFVRHQINLDSYAGELFQVCFEGITFAAANQRPGDSTGDRVFIDNILLEGSQLPTAIDLPRTEQLSVFPNPSTSQFALRIKRSAAGRLNLRITDFLGQPILQQDWQVSGGTQSLALDLSQQAAGVYVLRLSDGEKSWTRKLIKQ